MDEETLDIAGSVEKTKSKIISAFNNILRQRLAERVKDWQIDEKY